MTTTTTNAEDSCVVLYNSRKHYGMPDGGHWYWKQDPMLQFLAENGGGFAAGWDKTEGEGNKIYGVYKSAQEFFSYLLLCRDRWGYEMIPSGQKCKLYMDVEWEGALDADHAKLRWMLDEVRKYCQKTLEWQTELFVVCSTRAKVKDGEEVKDPDGNQVFKNSYHIVSPSVVFQRNHDGDMERFFTDMCHSDSKWYYNDDKNQRKCFLDLGVYTTNRCIRLPLCMKKGTATPFIRISGDPLDPNDIVDPKEFEGTEDAWEPFVLTNPPMSGDVKLVGSAQWSKKRKASHMAKQSIASTSKEDLPFQPKLLVELLRECGDNVSEVSKVTIEQDGWRCQCVKSQQGVRPCLVDKTRTHTSNNCLLFLKKKTGCFMVEYHCTSDKCKRVNVVLGHIRYQNLLYKWAFEKGNMDPMEIEQPISVESQEEDDPMCVDSPQQVDLKLKCARELMLMGHVSTDDPKFEILAACWFHIDPTDSEFIWREWRKRDPNYKHPEALPIQNDDSPSDPVQTMWMMRRANPVLVFQEQKPLEGIVGILRACNPKVPWQTLVRVMKQTYSEERDEVLIHVESVYGVPKSQSEPIWDLDDSFFSADIKQFIDMALNRNKLITDTLPRAMGYNLWSYEVKDQDTITFLLDCHPPKRHTLFLCTGDVAGTSITVGIPEHVFKSSPADKILADALVSWGLDDKLRFDVGMNTFRIFTPMPGKWRMAKDELEAVNFVMEQLNKKLQPMFHLQLFREELWRQVEKKKKSPHTPTSQEVHHVICQYANSVRNSKHVLQLLKCQVFHDFVCQTHLLCCANGLVNLKTLEFMGPAKPTDDITRAAVHDYDPNFDLTEFKAVLATYFPKECYDDAEEVLLFYQVWEGYRITGETGLQKAMFATGRGSNGKSSLSKLASAALGPDIHHDLSMEAFHMKGQVNNDDLFQGRNALCVDVMENTDNRLIDEKLFKTLVGGDKLQIAAKFITGQKIQPKMKVTFYNNDPPKWSSKENFALQRRIYNLPMRAQFLAENDNYMRDKLTSEGKEHYIFPRDPDFEKNLLDKYPQAALMWRIEGAKRFYDNNCTINVPKTVRMATESEQKDVVDELEEFVIEHLMAVPEDIPYKLCSISTAEIREVYFRKIGVVDVDEKTETEWNQTLKTLIIGNKKFEGVVQWKKLRAYPSRGGPKDAMGYVKIAWKAGCMGNIINAIRRSYKDDKRPPIVHINSNP